MKSLARRSVFSKLLIAGFGFTLLINAIVFFGTHWIMRSAKMPVVERIDASLGRATVSLARELEAAPGRETGERIKTQYGFEVATAAWATGEVTAERLQQEFRPERSLEGGQVELGRAGAAPGPVFRLHTTGGPIYFLGDHVIRTTVTPPRGRMLLQLVLVSLSILAVYLVVRRTIRPLKTLERGVVALTQGDLDHSVEIEGDDEFADMGRAFNQMRARIRAMLAEREQLLADMSHEFRSPLTRMRVALELMDGCDARDAIVEDVLELDSMVTHILESARLENRGGGLRSEKVALSALLDEKAAAAGPHPGVARHRPPAPVFAAGDPALLGILFKNLLENALKYSTGVAQPVEITEKQGDDGLITVVVRDHGPGIPAGERERVFEPFYRVDKSRSKNTGGFGLGLALCRKIALAHGGTIRLAAPAQGQGLEAIVTLPAASAPPS
jgi:signal transduction histidine kinase